MTYTIYRTQHKSYTYIVYGWGKCITAFFLTANITFFSFLNFSLFSFYSFYSFFSFFFFLFFLFFSFSFSFFINKFYY